MKVWLIFIMLSGMGNFQTIEREYIGSMEGCRDRAIDMYTTYSMMYKGRVDIYCARKWGKEVIKVK